MNSPTPELIAEFLTRLGNRCGQTVQLYFFGGTALLLLGSTRNTLDVDYTFTSDTPYLSTVRALIAEIAGSDDPIQLRRSLAEVKRRLQSAQS